MHLDTILFELSLVFGLCVGVSTLFHRFRLPPMVGFLVVGAFIGPNALGWVKHEELVEHLAEVGVIVLLFTVGLELAPREVLRLRRAVMVGGGVQIGGTVLLGAGAAFLGAKELGPSIFLGFLLALSSTAAVTKLLTDNGEFAAPHGRLSIALCIAQDLAVVPMILVLPLLGTLMTVSGDGGEAVGAGAVLLDTIEKFGILAALVIAAVLVVPRVISYVARTRSRELFVLTVVAVCLAMSAVTGWLEMSPALGAFFAGLILASTDYHHQAVSEVEPFRDALASLFFVSIGMLFDPNLLVSQPVFVLAAVAWVIGGKAIVVSLAARAVGLPGWVGWRAALTMAQVGEFSFILVQVGGGVGLMEPDLEKLFLVIAVLSIAVTPLLYGLGARLASRRGQEGDGPEHDGELRDHAIVIGFGPVGQATAKALAAAEIRYQAIEMNPSTVKVQKEAGVPIILGDATRAVVLQAAGIDCARLVVVAVADPGSALRTVAVVRGLNPHAHIVARAVYDGEVEPLRRAGADEVVPQELETSVEILVRSLRHFLVPSDEVGRQVSVARGGDRRASAPSADEDVMGQLTDWVPDVGIRVLRADHGAAILDKTLAKSGLRTVSGCTVVAIRKGDDTVADPGADTVVEEGDVVVVLGPKDRLADAAALFHGE